MSNNDRLRGIYQNGIKMCRDLEIYNKPLPKWHAWFTPTLKWRLNVNLILHQQNDPKIWIVRNNKSPGLAFHPLKNKKMVIKMQQICVKLSTGYCKIYEEILQINIPIPIQELIGKVYLYVEPSTFKDVHFVQDSPTWKWNRNRRKNII